MGKMKFKLTVLLAIFSLAFILSGCSSSDSDGLVVEAPASNYCKNGTHIYYPDPADEGKLIDYNSEDDSYTTLLDNSATGTKTIFDSIIAFDGNLYCGLRQSQDSMGSLFKKSLLKLNLETKECSQYDIDSKISSLTADSSKLWQVKNDIYFTYANNKNEMVIYKLDLRRDKITTVYTDKQQSYTLNVLDGIITITYIQNQTIYFIEHFPRNASLCSIKLNGKNYKEYREYERIVDAVPINNKLYFYALDKKNNSRGKYENYEFDTNTEVISYADDLLSKNGSLLYGKIRLYNGYVYGIVTESYDLYNKYNLYRVPADNLTAEPELVLNKGINQKAEIIDFVDDFVIVSDGNYRNKSSAPTYFVAKVDGSSYDRFYDLFSAYKKVFGLSSDSSNDESSSESETSNNFTIPSELTNLFDESIYDIYGNNGSRKLFSEGGGDCYKAPDSENTFYYFSDTGGDAEHSYLTAIEGPLNLLIPGKNTATIEELKEIFGASFSFDYSEYMGGYTASVQLGKYGISFGTFESEGNATVSTFRISK